MKIKIIDLFNKIANGEEVPKKIKVDGHKFEYDEGMDTYFEISEEYGVYSLVENWLNNSTKLNDEVEIIEEDKTIEELKTAMVDTERKLIGVSNSLRVVDDILIDKINELVKEINKIKENNND